MNIFSFLIVNSDFSTKFEELDFEFSRLMQKNLGNEIRFKPTNVKLILLQEKQLVFWKTIRSDAETLNVKQLSITKYMKCRHQIAQRPNVFCSCCSCCCAECCFCWNHVLYLSQCVAVGRCRQGVAVNSGTANAGCGVVGRCRQGAAANNRTASAGCDVVGHCQ